MKKLKEQFGGKITSSLKDEYAKSPQWKNGKFENLVETSMNITIWDIPDLIYKQLCQKENREPNQPLPILPFNQEAFLRDDTSFKYIWYGHSVILIRMNGKTLLIDPMLGSNASPIAPFKTKRFSKNTLDLIDDFPEIDLLLLTHDHYDHLDLDSIEKLKSKTKQYYVALGIKRHLIQWGVDENKIQEFDWWNQSSYDDIEITFTPTRHFSGRGLSDRAKSLWGGWVFNTTTNNVWFSGDGGYGEHFKEIGNKFGGFDFAFMECGQYNEKWHSIHMYPEESVEAAIDTQVKKAMPVHWAGFALSQHSWTEPIERFYNEAKKMGLAIDTPELGQLCTIDGIVNTLWWKRLLQT